MTSLFTAHPSIPNHYEISPGYVLVTSDMNQDTFKWSRLIRKNHIQGRGFLGHHETERIGVQAYRQQSEEDYQQLQEEELVSALEAIMIDGKETILHYHAPGEVYIVITGVDHGMLQQLPEQYHNHYYENH